MVWSTTIRGILPGGFPGRAQVSQAASRACDDALLKKGKRGLRLTPDFLRGRPTVGSWGDLRLGKGGGESGGLLLPKYSKQMDISEGKVQAVAVSRGRENFHESFNAAEW